MNKIGEVNFFQKNSLEPVMGKISINTPDVQSKTFKDTFADMVQEFNEITSKPENLTMDMMQGKADIHDVMAAVAQSELTVQAVTTVTGKILQTYEKIMQIQI